MTKCPKCKNTTWFHNYQTYEDGERVWESSECADCGWMVN